MAAKKTPATPNKPMSPAERKRTERFWKVDPIMQEWLDKKIAEMKKTQEK